MRVRIVDHDVTCLCAIASLPKRVIVEARSPRNGQPRLRLQSFTPGSIGDLLEWIGPVLERSGAEVRRWESGFAFARITFRTGRSASAALKAMAAVDSLPNAGVSVVLPEPTLEGPLDWRIADLVEALSDPGRQFTPISQCLPA